jgi:hypothetical protein
MEKKSYYLVKVVTNGGILKFATEKEPDMDNWHSTKEMLEIAGIVKVSGCEETIGLMDDEFISAITWTLME